MLLINKLMCIVTAVMAFELCSPISRHRIIIISPGKGFSLVRQYRKEQRTGLNADADL